MDNETVTGFSQYPADMRASAHGLKSLPSRLITLMKCHIRELNAAISSRQKCSYAARNVALAEDRLRHLFDMPRSLFLDFEFAAPDSYRSVLFGGALSVKHILELYHDPAERADFDADLIDAIEAYELAMSQFESLKWRASQPS